VFLFLFVVLAAVHMIILQVNLKRSHKFLASGALFGFCMARITTCVIRLVWSTHTNSIPIAIAANVFVNAGIIIIIIINIIFAQRIMRASNPALGWHKLTGYVFLAYYVSIVLLLVALITSVVQQLYTLDDNIRRIDHDLQLVGSTYFAVAAFMPIILVVIGVVLPKYRRNSAARHVEKFGSGRFRTKVRILLLSSALITLGAAFRAGTAYVPRPVQDPAWYHSKACFYTFNFAIEIVVLVLYAAIRVDRRFHVLNGANAPGDYSADSRGAAEKVKARILSEEEVMEDVRDRNEEMSGIGTDVNEESQGKRVEVELKTGIDVPPVAKVA
jgi:heme exporter protein D